MRGFHLLRQRIQRPALHLPRLSPPRIQFLSGTARCQMSSQREDSIPHELRTAAEPRQNRLYPVRLSHVDQVNPSVRLLQLAIPSQENPDEESQPFTFMPGQWLDVHIPSIAQAGGFTITSTPADAQLLPLPEPQAEPLDGDTAEPSALPQGRAPYVELAVQDSPANPSAAWLWKPKEEILGKELNIRVGGSFVWPPTGINTHKIKNVVFIAGGVGINPLISILSHLNTETQDAHRLNISFLYSTRLPQGHDAVISSSPLDQILFLPRLRQIMRSQVHSRRLRISLDLFLTNDQSSASMDRVHDLRIQRRRINDDDLRSAVVGGDGKNDPQDSVCYVCGPPAMTDETVRTLQAMLGENGAQRIFYEKWW
ncbi:Riboflavin synthase-like beta-barrel [Penicillium hispanicum]|uniref:Riboflavin synthase-like beta-barrel n=1 Tax=Penicillium hispanicum TaxID=1080232 RepID=UPI00253FAE72|nr:Riboflavin synthase-like beta-barrel [Penicillium hispanicum]KAJ5570058.1 Riboflavin synthase-like beta-barrel [Penicillium hispanicum]